MYKIKNASFSLFIYNFNPDFQNLTFLPSYYPFKVSGMVHRVSIN